MNTAKHEDTVPADIAVIGMGCRLPGADSPEQYWRNIREGVESIRFFDDDELRAAGVPERVLASPRYVRASAALQHAEDFDAGYFGYVAREAELMDPQHRLFLECAVWALEDAGYDPARYRGLMGVYAGSTMNTYLLLNLVANRGVLDAVGDHATMIGNDKDYVALRVAYKLGLQGPAMVVQTACSSSLTAVHVAAQAILAGECDMAIAGGASLRLPHNAGYLQNATASPDGHCRPFDAAAAGSVVGNGAGAVVLKHLSDALRDGDHIHAVIAGTAVSNDGRAKTSFTAPGVGGQARAAASAVMAAGISADVIEYVETHGTGTALGDPIEVAALTKAYQLTTTRRGYCALGSVKANIGHLDAAAGVAGLIKTVLALEHRTIPPLLHFNAPNPEIDFDSSPFHVPTELLPFEGEEGRPRYAAVHSLGMGGANAHVVLHEAPAPSPTEPAPDGQLVLLSARSAAALEERMAQAAQWMREHPAASLADVAYTLQVGRAEHEHRASVVARDLDDAASALGARGSSRIRTSLTADQAGPVVFLFPGQGSQSVGMGAELRRTEPVFRDAVDECLSLLPEDVSGRLRPLLSTRRNPSDESLTPTDLAQPALFVVEYALAKLLQSYGINPAALLGHSIGEYVAATLAGVFSLADALSIVATRGRLVASLPAGAMLSVPLPEDEVARMIAAVPGLELSVAAVNTPGLVAVAGTPEAVARFEEELRAKGVPNRALHVSHAFHSAMLDPIVDEFTMLVGKATLRPPTIPVISNVTGRRLTEAEATDPAYWGRHLRETVRFADGLRLAVEQPGSVLIEVGPGAQLAALARATLGEQAAPVATLLPAPDQRTGERTSLLRGLAELWHQGVRLDWARTHDRLRRRIPLPVYPFQRSRYWIDPAPQVEAGAAIPLPVGRGGPQDWIYRPAWTQAPRRPAAAPPSSVLILADGGGVGAALADRLRAQGAATVRVVAADADAVAATRAAFTVEAGFPEAVVHLRSLDAADQGTDSMVGLDAGSYSLLELLPALNTPRGRATTVHYVTRHVFDVTGEDPVRPELATAVGLCRVVPQESGVRCRVVELDPRDPGTRMEQTVSDLIAELGVGDGAAEAEQAPVALRGRVRFVQRHERVRLDDGAADASAARAGGAHLVLGGLGLVGRTLAAELLRDPAAKVVLFDRAEPEALDAAARRQFEELRASGRDRLVLLRGDVTDRQAVADAVAEAVRSGGRLATVVYTPGLTVADGIRSLSDSSRALFEAHLATKATGLQVLDEALAAVSYDRCLVVGSLSSVLGGIGSGAYTAANWYADTFVARRNRGAERAWVNVQWEHWHEGDAAPGAGLREDAGCGPDEARELFRLLAGIAQDGPFTVSVADPDARQAEARRAEARVGAAPAAVPGGAGVPGAGMKARPEVSVPFVAPRDEVEEYVAGMWRDLLGISQIGVRDSFFELGGQSLLAMQLVARLRDEHGIELPLGTLFQDATVAALAQMVRAAGEGGQEAGVPQPDAAEPPLAGDDVDDEELERLLSEIESLSDEDVEARLRQGRAGER